MNMLMEGFDYVCFPQSHQSVLKALEEDANVFEYDSLYDEMQEKKKKQDPRLAKKDRTVRLKLCHA